jgi:hypothetical protein
MDLIELYATGVFWMAFAIGFIAFYTICWGTPALIFYVVASKLIQKFKK